MPFAVLTSVQKNIIVPPAAPLPFVLPSGSIRNYDAGNVSSYPGTGTTWTDLAGSGYNMTLYNSPTFVSSGAGSYFDFDGTNDYAEAVNTGLPTGNSAITMVYWSYKLSTARAKSMVGFGGTGAYTCWFGYTETNGWILDNGANTVGPNPSMYVNGEWSMIGLSYGSDSTYINYYNGSERASGGTSTLNLGTVDPLSIGKGYRGLDYGLARIGKLILWNRKLSTAEFNDIWNGQKADYGY
jgi:hypothetical protein